MDKRERRFGKWVKRYGRDTAVDMENAVNTYPDLFYAIEKDGMIKGGLLVLAGNAIGLVISGLVISAIESTIKKN